MYPEHLTAPMEKDLTDYGFQGLKTPDAVSAVLDKKEGTVLVVVNSVCGCAAGNCRPGVKQAVKNEVTPDQIVTVFAGVDKEATAEARNLMVPFPPSSPSIALFNDGELVHMLERHHIEGRSANIIAENLKEAYNTHC